MAFENEKQKTEYVSMGKGTFPARIVHLIDMGKQHIQGYKDGKWFPLYYAKDAEGNDIKNEDGYTKQVAEDTGYPVVRPMYRVTFEFPTKTREFNGEQMPRWLKKEYTFSGLEKLANLLSGGDILALVGSPCLVGVGQTAGGYDKATSVSEPVEGMEIAPLKNPTVLFDFDDPDKKQWDNIPTWYLEDIKKAVNYEGSPLQRLVEGSEEQPASSGDDFDDDSPY